MYIGIEHEGIIIGGETNRHVPAIVGNLGTITAFQNASNHRTHFYFCRKCFAREVQFYGEYCEFCTTRKLAPESKFKSWKFAVLILICLFVVVLRFCDFQPVAATVEKVR